MLIPLWWEKNETRLVIGHGCASRATDIETLILFSRSSFFLSPSPTMTDLDALIAKIETKYRGTSSLIEEAKKNRRKRKPKKKKQPEKKAVQSSVGAAVEVEEQPPVVDPAVDLIEPVSNPLENDKEVESRDTPDPVVVTPDCTQEHKSPVEAPEAVTREEPKDEIVQTLVDPTSEVEAETPLTSEEDIADEPDTMSSEGASVETKKRVEADSPDSAHDDATDEVNGISKESPRDNAEIEDTEMMASSPTSVLLWNLEASEKTCAPVTSTNRFSILKGTSSEPPQTTTFPKTTRPKCVPSADPTKAVEGVQMELSAVNSVYFCDQSKPLPNETISLDKEVAPTANPDDEKNEPVNTDTENVGHVGLADTEEEHDAAPVTEPLVASTALWPLGVPDYKATSASICTTNRFSILMGRGNERSCPEKPKPVRQKKLIVLNPHKAATGVAWEMSMVNSLVFCDRDSSVSSPKHEVVRTPTPPPNYPEDPKLDDPTETAKAAEPDVSEPAPSGRMVHASSLHSLEQARSPGPPSLQSSPTKKFKVWTPSTGQPLPFPTIDEPKPVTKREIFGSSLPSSYTVAIDPLPQLSDPKEVIRSLAALLGG